MTDDIDYRVLAEDLQHPCFTAALDAALLDVRNVVASDGAAVAVQRLIEKALPWPSDETAAILGLALVRLAKAEAVEVRL